MNARGRRLSVAASLLLAWGLVGAVPVGAAPITIDLVATVRAVDDVGGLLAGRVVVGDTITGRYVYESTTPDSNALAAVGDYRHTAAPFGIALSVNGLEFRTDPANVDFLVELCNDHGAPAHPHDAYLLRSYDNLFDVSYTSTWVGDRVDDHIAWQLADWRASTILTSTDLLLGPPPLTGWSDAAGLEISSYRSSDASLFTIRADVTSATLAASEVPEPASWTLLALGIGGLIGRRRRRPQRRSDGRAR